MTQSSPVSRSAAPADTGFNIVELMMAILILLIGIVALAQVIPASLNYDSNNRSNSIALISAQRELEQMVRPSLTAQGEGGPCSALAGHYYFCDSDGNTVGLGQVGSGSTPTQAGCPLDSTGTQLDFTLSCSTSGYSLIRLAPWDQVSGIKQKVELRWRVVTMMNSGTPARKFIIIGARAWQAGGLTLVTNLQAVVGPH